nr:hypothetical protein [Tanacetum cinerariifolium]
MVAYLLKTEGSEGFHQIMDFLITSHIKYALTENPIIYTSLIQQFWQTAAANTLDIGEVQITAAINGKVKLIFEASIWRNLKFKDSDGISTLPNTKIFEQLALMGVQFCRVKDQQSQLSPITHPQLSSPTHTNVADEAASIGVDVRHGGAATTVSSLDARQGSEVQGRHDQEIKFETEDISTAETLVYIRRSAYKDKRKGIMTESELEQTTTKLQQKQERAGYEATVRLQEQLNEEERIQAEEKEKYSEAEKARLLVDLINQQRNILLNKELKKGEISHLHRLTRGPTCLIITIPKIADESSKRDAEEELEQESSKRQKTRESSKPREKEDDELTQEELQQMMMIVLVEEVYVEALQTSMIYSKGLLPLVKDLLLLVILNGDAPLPTRVIKGVVQPLAPTTAEQRLARKNELKARGTLLIALPDKYQLKFNSHKDAKTLMEAIEKRFGGNKETKMVHKTLLKQQYENFTGSSSESLDQIHDRLQKLISQLEILGEYLSQEDINLNLKIYKAEVKSSFSSITSTQNTAFVLYQNTDSTNESVSAAASAKQIDVDYLEEMDLKWHMAMLTIRARRFLQETGWNLGANGTTSIGFDMSKVECYNCHRRGNFARECRSPKDTRRNVPVEPQKRNVPVETSTSNALVLQYDGVDSYDWSFQAEEEPTNYALMAFTSLSYDNQVFNSSVFDCDEMFSFASDVSMPASPIYDRYQSGIGYHAVPPPYTGTFMPPKPDLVFHDAPNVSEIVHTAFNVELSPTKPDQDISQSNRPTTPIIEDWVFDSEDKSEAEPSQNDPSFVQPNEQVKNPRPSVKLVEHFILAINLRKDSPKSKGHRNNKNRKACFVCKSLTHLTKDCDYYEKKMVQTLAKNHVQRGNHQYYARMTHLNPQRHVVPTLVLTRSKLVLLTAARPLTTAVHHNNVIRPRPTKTVGTKTNSPPRRTIIHRPSPPASNFPSKVTTVKASKVNAIKGVQGNWGNPQHALKDKGVIDNGCSRHMIGNMSYLTDFEEINGGYVAFGGNTKGRKITDPQNTDEDATFKVKEPEFEVKKPESKVHVSPSRFRNLSEEFEDFPDNSINEVNAASTPVLVVGQISTNNTNTFSAAGPSNTAVSLTHGKSSYVDPSQYPDDLNMPALEDITYFDDDEDVGVKADFTNLETTINVSPIPTTRVHKDHLVTQIISDLSLATQTRSMTRMVKDQGGLTQINNEDIYTCMFAYFLS